MTPERPVLVVLPTYNERENVERVLQRVLAATDRADVLVVDDGSPDGTAALVRAFSAQCGGRVTLQERPGKSGLGSAYLLAMRHAIACGYAGVCTMDADNSHDPAALPQMIDALADADLVIGSRYVAGGSTDQPLVRRVNSAVANALARGVLNIPIRDCTSGFRLYSTDLLRRISLASMRSRGYSMLVELLCTVLDADGRVVEVPIAFRDRDAGSSKVVPGEIWESLRTIARLRRGRLGGLRTRAFNALYRILPLKDKVR